jgi:hypothetical protein
VKAPKKEGATTDAGEPEGADTNDAFPYGTIVK